MNPLSKQHAYISSIVKAGLCALVGSIIVLCLVPPISRDALIHHLAVPKLYLRHGGVYEIPSMVFSYFPMNIDFLYMIPLYFGNDIAPKLIHFGFALLTAWVVFRYLTHRISALYGLIGASFFLSIPIVIKLSITAYVDLGLIFFSTSSLLLLFKWIEDRFNKKYLIASAVSCGLALGTKYNALICFFLLSSFVPFMYSRYAKTTNSPFVKPTVQAIIYILISLLIFSPWMIRNWHWKKNPIYPMYNHVFTEIQSLTDNHPRSETKDRSTSVSRDSNAEHDEKYWIPGLFGLRHYLYGESLWEIMLVPLRIFFQGKDGNPEYFDGRLNPFLLILPFFAFYRRETGDEQLVRSEKMLLLSYAVLYFAFVFFSSVVRIRYLSPIVPPLVILSVFGLKNIADRIGESQHATLKRVGKLSVLAVIISCFGYNLVYLTEQFAYVKPIHYLTGKLTRHEYIEKFRFEYPAMRYINDNLPTNSRIFFLFMGKRGYYCDREYLPDNANNMMMMIKSADKPLHLYASLKEKGVTHMLIQMPLMARWVNSVLNDQEVELLNGFFANHLTLEYQQNDVALFSINNLTS